MASSIQALRQKPALVLLLAWPLTVYLFLAGIAWQNPRFSLAFFPPLLVLLGLGIEWLWQQLAPKWRPFLILWCAVGLLGSLAWTVRDVRNFTQIKDANVAAVQWAEAQTGPGATAVTFGVTLIMNHYTSLNGLDIYTLAEGDLAGLLANDAPFYLLLDVTNVEQQWQGKSPQLNYQWLQEQAELVEIGRFNNYTLFEVKVYENRPHPAWLQPRRKRLGHSRPTNAGDQPQPDGRTPRLQPALPGRRPLPIR